MMIGLVFLIVGLIGQWLLGMFVSEITLTFRRPLRLPFAELAGLGCAMGIGLTAFTLFMWSFCGGSLGILPTGLLAVAGYLAGGSLLITRWRSGRSDSSTQPSQSLADRDEIAVCRACQIVIAVLFVICTLETLQTPQKLWDERAIFALKARVLFEDRSINGPELLHPDWVQYHPRYPLLLPLAEANVYALVGRVDDRLSKLLFPLLYCGLVLTTAGVLMRHVSRGRAWLGALVLATVPVMLPYEYGFLCGQADAPVACFHGLSVLYLWDGLSRQARGSFPISPFVMAGMSGGLAAFTKDEGIAFLIVDTASLGLMASYTLGSRSANTMSILTRLSRSFRAILLFIVSAGAVVVPWFVHRRVLPTTTEMNYVDRMTVTLFVGRLNTLGWSVPHLVHRMFWEWREWGLQWWLMLAGFACNPARAIQPPQLFLILDVAGALVSLMVAGMLAPAQLDEHIGGSSHRFLMQISPAAVLFAVAVFAGTTNDDTATPIARDECCVKA